MKIVVLIFQRRVSRTFVSRKSSTQSGLERKERLWGPEDNGSGLRGGLQQEPGASPGRRAGLESRCFLLTGDRNSSRASASILIRYCGEGPSSSRTAPKGGGEPKHSFHSSAINVIRVFLPGGVCYWRHQKNPLPLSRFLWINPKLLWRGRTFPTILRSAHGWRLWRLQKRLWLSCFFLRIWAAVLGSGPLCRTAESGLTVLGNTFSNRGFWPKHVSDSLGLCKWRFSRVGYTKGSRSGVGEGRGWSRGLRVIFRVISQTLAILWCLWVRASFTSLRRFRGPKRHISSDEWIQRVILTGISV